MKDIHLTILGCCRNNEKYIDKIQALVKSIVILFKSYDIHIAHNDSTDNTDIFLSSWAREDPNCFTYCMDGLAAKIPKRTQRLAFCRNFLLEKVKRAEDRWLLILDMDSVNSDLFQGFENVFRLDSEKWAALFINQDERYYDIWALRTKKMNWDCWEMIRSALMSGTDLKTAKKTYIRQYQTPIISNSKVVPVLSAFGGAGLYQTKYLKDCKYIGLNKKGEETCEHVSFHEGITKNGGKMYILPCWQNKTASEHIVSA
jgi:hypothetical protein